MFEKREVQSRGRGASTLGELPADPTQNSPPSALLQLFLPPPPPSHPPLRIQSSMSFSLLTQRLLDPLSNMNPCDQCVSKPLKYISLKYLPELNVAKFYPKRRNPIQEFIDYCEILSGAKMHVYCKFMGYCMATALRPQI